MESKLLTPSPEWQGFVWPDGSVGILTAAARIETYTGGEPVPAPDGRETTFRITEQPATLLAQMEYAGYDAIIRAADGQDYLAQFVATP